MASRRGPAYWVGLCLGWLLVAGWLALLALNAEPYFQGAATPPLGDLLTRLVTPPSLPLPPDLAALVGWALAAVALLAVVILSALTISPPQAAPAKPPLTPLAGAALPANTAPPFAPSVAPVEQASAVAAPVVEVAPTRRRVFISHASKDNDFGAPLVERLRRELGPDYDIWYDSKGRPGPDGLWADGIRPAANWQDEIMRALKDADIFLVILSPAAMASPWVADELGLAWSRKNINPNIEAGLVVVPILRETCDAPLWLNLIQRVDFTGWQAQGWDGDTRTWDALLSAMRDTRTRAKPVELTGPPFDLALLPPLERFIGREQAVRDVIALLTGPGAGQQANVAAANGLGGIGKTALATEVARRLMGRRDFPDGIAVVDCRDQHGPEAAQALLRKALGRFTDGRKEPESDDPAELADAARTILAGKHALVILDNVETGDKPEKSLPVATIITPLRSAGAAVLSTSREPLAAVPAGATLRLDVLPEEEAMELFEQYFGRELSAEGERAARVIVSALGRHTLATKLAAANAATLGRPLAAIARDLETSPDKALQFKSSDEAVLWVLESSAASLSSEARRLFAALSAFATSDIGRMAALAVAKALDDPNPDASLDRLLSLRLTDSGYLEALPGGDKADRERVRLHPLVRAYARDLFDSKRTVAADPAWTADQREQVERAIAAWYGDYMPKVNNASPTGYLALTPDEANITGALHWALAHNDDRAAARICDGIRGFWRDTGRTRAGHHYLPLGAAAAGRLASRTGRYQDRLLQAQIAGTLGDILIAAGQLDEAEAIFASQTSEQQIREPNMRITVIGPIPNNGGAIEVGSASNDQVRTIHELQRKSELYSRLAHIALQRGQLKEADNYYKQALSIDRELSDRQAVGADLTGLGQIAVRRGQFEEAESYLLQALNIDHELSDRRGESVDLASLGRVAKARGRLEDAQSYFQQSLIIRRELRDRSGEETILFNLGQLELERKRSEEAAEYLQQALPIAREVSDRRGEGLILVTLGQTAMLTGQLEEAKGYFEAGISVAREVGDQSTEGGTLIALGQLAQLRGDLSLAETHYRAGLAIWREVQEWPNVAAVLVQLGQLMIRLGSNNEEGHRMLDEAIALWHGMGLADREEQAREIARRFGYEPRAEP